MLILHSESDVISNYEIVMGSLPGDENMVNVSKGGPLFNNSYGYAEMGTFNNPEPYRTITVAPNGSLCHLHTTYTSRDARRRAQQSAYPW